MADTFKIQITTPEKLVLDGEATSAEIPAKDGYIGILPGHAALLTQLGEGTLRVQLTKMAEEFEISGGYMEIREDQVRVLADRVS